MYKGRGRERKKKKENERERKRETEVEKRRYRGRSNYCGVECRGKETVSYTKRFIICLYTEHVIMPWV